jgi:hypothetical protein
LEKDSMKPYFFILFAFLVMACTSPEEPTIDKQLWVFNPQNNQENFDKALLPLLNNYQELLKGVAVADTTYVLNAAKTLIQLTDSFPAAAITFKDSLLKEQAKQSLNNINAELQGLIAEQSLPALHLATHMVSIQFLNLLASVGYHQKNIYIYNVQDEKLEDGMIWFGWNKTSKDPYHPNRKEEIKAQQLLQE